MTPAPGPDGDLSLARLALAVMGTAAAVLVLVAALIVVVEPGPLPGLVIALGGVVAAVAGMGAVSKRMTRRAFGDPSDADEGDAGSP